MKKIQQSLGGRTESAHRALDQYFRSQKEYENHWIWQQLGCSPDSFFRQVRRELSRCGISESKRRQIQSGLRDQHRAEVLERQRHGRAFAVVSQEYERL